MKKFAYLVGLTIGFIVCMLIMIAIQPITNEIVSTANTTTNWTGFESTQHAIEAWPLYYWFIPVGIYLIVFAVLLKTDESQFD